MVFAIQRAAGTHCARGVFRGALEKPSCQKSFGEMVIQCGQSQVALPRFFFAPGRRNYLASEDGYSTRQRLSRKNCVTRCINTRRAGGSLTPWPRPGKAKTSSYFPASISSLMTV